jgi:GTP-binding protein
MTFTVAIVGRPNVGKSTLFNRLVGRRVALVDDRPGVTRDRREGEARLGDLDFTVIDTAGLEESAPESLSGRMRAQTQTAIGQADAIFFMIDARIGRTPEDSAFAELVRKSGKPTVLIANKMEGTAGEPGRLDAYALGLGEPVGISAEHNEGMPDLYDALRAAIPELTAEQIESAGEEKGPKPIRVAIVGRPNAGKSTLVNRLIGEERLLTAPEAGTTRDAIAVDLDWRGQKFRLFDTAGIRRRARVDEKLEKLSVADALNAVRFAEVVVVLLDVENAFEEQDQRIADLVEQEGRAIVIAVNKWDLKEHTSGAISKLRIEANEKLTQMKGVPLVAVSAMTGEGLDRLMQAIIDAFEVWNKRIPTSALNRWFEHATESHPPPAVSGRRLRLNYITQAKTRPPSFVLFCTRADALPEAYKRYLTNSLREAFEMPGTPLRLTLREKANPFEGRAKFKH